MDWTEFCQLQAKLKRPLIMAHRGASAVRPENTSLAFQRALEDGADVLETDLHFTKDDEIVLVHIASQSILLGLGTQIKQNCRPA